MMMMKKKKIRMEKKEARSREDEADLGYVPMPCMGAVERTYIVKNIEPNKVERHKCPLSIVQSVDATRQNGPQYSKEKGEREREERDQSSALCMFSALCSLHLMMWEGTIRYRKQLPDNEVGLVDGREEKQPCTEEDPKHCTCWANSKCQCCHCQ